METYYQQHKEILIQRAKAWHLDNRERAIERMRAKRIADKEAGIPNTYYLKKRDQILERNKQLRAAAKLAKIK